MKRDRYISAFVQLGKLLNALAGSEKWTGYACGITEKEYLELDGLIRKQVHHNGWFTDESVRKVFSAWGELLQEDLLKNWLLHYTFSEDSKRVGIIMAGNIPLVGFHDFLSVILSGNKAVIKLSSDDKMLLPALIDILVQFDATLSERIEISPGKLGKIDAIIATGSNNSMMYFEQYFGKYPHLFRKNRTSLAILDGSESEDELRLLGEDLFCYFGLGCRNVSQLLIPKDFDLDRFFGAIVAYGAIVNHHKYANNYDYNKAIYLMNLEQILDNGFLLLKEDESLFSPLAMLHYHRYENQEEISTHLTKNREHIQAVVGNKYIPFGKAQTPALSDYADGVDTMKWLEGI